MPAPVTLVALWRPAFLSVAPGVIFGAMVWAHVRYAELYPQAAAMKPATVSSALNDPRIAQPFALALLLAAPFLAVSIAQVIRFYRRCIATLWPPGTPEFRHWRRLFLAVVWLQALAALGMVVGASAPSDSMSELHLAGSYLLFFGHAGSILLSGHLGRAFSRRAARGGCPPELELRHFWLRWPASIGIVALALGYGALFYARDIAGFSPGYGYYLAVALVEIATISSFLLYLISFGWELFHADRRRLAARARLAA